MVNSIKAVGAFLGLMIEDEDAVTPTTNRLRRIIEKLKGNLATYEAVIAAEQAVEEEGGRAIMQAFAQCNAIVPEREYKIKRVAKGTRIKMISPSGIHFSFGPVWNDSILAAKGIALNEMNREKLNMHGTYFGIDNPEAMAGRELCALIATRIE